MAYKILPGVQQDYRGRKFLQAVYPNGKVIMVPYSEDPQAPRAATLAVPEEPAIKPKRRIITTRSSDGTLKEMRFRPKRLNVVECRLRGELRKFSYDNREDFEELLDHLRPLMQSHDCGKTWRAVESNISDWHNAYHLDSKEPQNA